MESYYETLIKEREVEIPVECIMAFVMFCYLKGTGHVESRYVGKGTKLFYFA